MSMSAEDAARLRAGEAAVAFDGAAARPTEIASPASARTEAISDQDALQSSFDPNGPMAERFIPVSRFEILDRMTRPQLWGAYELDDAKKFYRYLAAWRHIVYNERLTRLEEDYLPFSPETDLIRVGQYRPEDRVALRKDLIRHMRRLLEQANYTEITLAELKAELEKSKSEYGLELAVDLEDFEELVMYRRGISTQSMEKRDWRSRYYKTRTVEFPVYQRLFVLLKLKPEEQRVREVMAQERIEIKQAQKMVKKRRRMLPKNVLTEHIYIKLFKDIPQSDVKMMFPNTQVRFRRLDKLKLGVTAGGGTAAGAFAAATKILAAANPVTAGIAIVTLGGVVFRQVSDVMAQKNHYMLTLAKNLYFHSLADNRGVITLLASRAEEEDIKEEMLLYCVLAKERVRYEELADVKLAIEQFLLSEFAVEVNYDVEDALDRLTQDGIAFIDGNGMIGAMSPTEGCRHLDGLWDSYLNPEVGDRTLLSEDKA